MKSIIGTFIVKDNSGRKRNVIISQELVEGKNSVVESAMKQHNIDKQDGERVFATTDPATFMLEDGTKLKKIGGTHL